VARPDKEPTFLRRPQAVPRKRRPALLRVLLLAALGLAAGVGLLRFAASSRFALTRYDVSGNTRARTEEILVALAAWKGKNLVALDLEPLASRLGRHPWIERVTLAKRFPDGLAIRVTERRALALYRDGESFSWVGADGRLIAPYDSRLDRTTYVILSGDPRTLPEAVGLLGDLQRERPEYFAALSEIASLPDGGFGMMDAIFRRPVRVLRADAPEKVRALLEARSFVKNRGWEARAIDLRFADRVILVGAYGAGNRL
jgi:cell division septal protein FtsQ